MTVLSLQLPVTNTDAKPAFMDLPGCQQWVSQLQFTNIQQAHLSVSAEVSKLNTYTLSAAERLGIMEALRETVAHVQSEYAKRFSLKALPLNASESAAFTGIIDLWRGMLTSYQHCLQACIDGDAELAASKALLHQRCMNYLSQPLLEYFRAGHEFDPELWKPLHQQYAFAEEQAVATIEVNDPLHQPGGASSCVALYVKALLICQSNPYELTRGQQQLLDNWLNSWSSMVSIGKTPPASDNDIPPLMIDLEGTGCVQYQKEPPANPALRFLDTSGLSEVMRLKLTLLRQGQPPEAMGLGKECVQPACLDLLTRLHQLWLEGRSARFLERRSAASATKMCFGIVGTHLYATGKPFKQPKKSGKLTQKQQNEIAAFGHVVSHTGRTDIAQMGFPLENWKILDQSALGMRMVREGTEGERVSHNRLIGMRPDNGEYYMLGAIRWIMVSRNGHPQIGARIMPGVPQPISLRAAGVNVQQSEPYVQAFLLPSVTALQTAPTLVIPNGWFRPKRVVEIMQGDVSQNVTLDILLEHGTDYERVGFEPV